MIFFKEEIDFGKIRSALHYLPKHWVNSVSNEILSYYNASELFDIPLYLQKSIERLGEDHLVSKWYHNLKNNFTYPRIYRKNTDRIGPLTEWCIDNNALQCIGIIPTRKVPLVEDYENVLIENSKGGSLVVLSGSWLYGLENSNSDFDLCVISKQGIKSPTDRLDAYILTCDINQWHIDLMRGKRYAWEILQCPERCILHTGEISHKIQSLRNKVKISCSGKGPHTVPVGYFRSSSTSYFLQYFPYFKCDLHEIPDPKVRNWTASYGWAYKLGYYILVDNILSKWAYDNQLFDLREPFQDEKTKHVVLACKEGLLDFQTWKKTVRPFLTPTCQEMLDD